MRATRVGADGVLHTHVVHGRQLRSGRGCRAGAQPLLQRDHVCMHVELLRLRVLLPQQLLLPSELLVVLQARTRLCPVDLRAERRQILHAHRCLARS
jgi:hypothetical protein